MEESKQSSKQNSKQSSKPTTDAYKNIHRGAVLVCGVLVPAGATHTPAAENLKNKTYAQKLARLVELGFLIKV
ncbi:MAG: hypothetical protein IBX55_08810 [Methyloprofundus sp.]|nr:hypothetical protein [Methyloprofundus sp.]